MRLGHEKFNRPPRSDVYWDEDFYNAAGLLYKAKSHFSDFKRDIESEKKCFNDLTGGEKYIFIHELTYHKQETNKQSYQKLSTGYFSVLSLIFYAFGR